MPQLTCEAVCGWHLLQKCNWLMYVICCQMALAVNVTDSLRMACIVQLPLLTKGLVWLGMLPCINPPDCAKHVLLKTNWLTLVM